MLGSGFGEAQRLVNHPSGGSARAPDENARG